MKITLCNGQGAREASRGELETLLASHDHTLWVDFTGPGEDDLRLMREVFKFHPLAIEDTYNQEQRPKIEEYPNHLFLIMNPVSFNGDDLNFRELDVFVGRNYIVTVHTKPEPAVDEFTRRVHNGPVGMGLSPGYLMYVILDVVVDSYFPIMDRIEEAIGELEDIVLTKPRRESLDRLFQLKRMLVDMWRVVWPQRDALSILSSHNLKLIDQQAIHYYLRDVFDHLIWVADMVNTFRDTLTSIADLYMSAVSNRLNRTVNRLTVLTLIIGTFTVISGFYGMNFEATWPPFKEAWGVPFVLALMVMGMVALLTLIYLLGRE